MADPMAVTICPHVVISGTMLYMLAGAGAVATRGAASGEPMAGMGTMSGHLAGSPVVIALLAAFMLGYVVWTADRLTLITADRRLPGCSLSLARPGGRVGAGPAVRPFLAPRLASYCEIATSVRMAYMLVTML